MKWLYELPEESRREVLELQERRALALQLAMGLCIDTKKPPMSKEAARRIVAKCNKKIEQIAKGAAVL